MYDIYLLIDGKREGPFTEDEVTESLADGSIAPSLLAWYEGLDHWVPISNILDEDPLASSYFSSIYSVFHERSTIRSGGWQ